MTNEEKKERYAQICVTRGTRNKLDELIIRRVVSTGKRVVVLDVIEEALNYYIENHK